MNCPSEVALLALVGGELDENELTALDAHVDGCGECQAVVAALAQGPGATAGALAVGTRLGRYVVLGRAGAGAMGDVYAAWDGELGRRVALKVLRSEELGDRRARTLREAQAMARLSHPHAVGVYEVGAESETIFLAMEWVEGKTLREWSVGRSWRELRDAFVTAAEVLAAAHRAGLVHRGFKPDHVPVDGDG